MSYKTILVHVDSSSHVNLRIEIAATLAARFDAHLVGLALTGVPDIYFDPLMLNPVDLAVEPLLKVPRQRAADALANFEAIARQHGVGSTETRLEENESVEGVILQARYCDLVVLGQYDPDDTESITSADFPERVILECAVPVLMVPYGGASTGAGTGTHALLSWNASKQAVHAAHFALPMLERAAQVDVAVFDPDRLPTAYRAVPDKQILAWLGRHQVVAKVTRQVIPSDIDIANALLSLARGQGADLLVMGAYGHTRFREIMLGGVTREILRSMTLPVLMAH
jgi:nucleotide-binding universal stress UspA family protein